MTINARRMLFAGLALVTLAGAIGARAQAHTIARTAAQTPPAVDATALYRLHCQMCHGLGGKAPLAEMAFVGRDWKNGTSSAQMAKVIAEGVKGTPMMPFKGKLKPEQITALAKHVRAFDTRLKPERP
jgi:mono/diheme cytochrome c family protein